jgi:hypothetical protein
MAERDDDHKLPLDPTELERTTLYAGDDEQVERAIRDGVHDAATELKDPAAVRAWIDAARHSERRRRAGVIAFATVAGLVVAGAVWMSTAEAPQPAAGGSDSVAASFARQSARVRACLASHAGDLGDVDQIDIGFEIRTDGAVARATIAPARLAGTPLGRCVLEAAQRIRFAQQESPLSIRIPMPVRPGM